MYFIHYFYFCRKANCSYLDAPRIHFRGKFRADVNSHNNDHCNFDLNNKLSEDNEWNYRGTNEWEFVGTVVTAVVGEDGAEILDSSLLGTKVFSNENQPFGKIVDIDVDFQVSSLYGLKFGLKDVDNTKNLFVGKWSPLVIVHDLWPKLRCNSTPIARMSSTFGAQSTTRIIEVKWSDSEHINPLKNATKNENATGELSVSITLDMYRIDVFLIGRVIGTIDVAKVDEPLNVGGERKLRVDIWVPSSLTFPPHHPCHGAIVDSLKPWANSVPFKINKARNVLIADLGNALPIQQNGNPLDIGTLYFGFLKDSEIQPFGEPIPYTNINSTMWRHSGILEYHLDADLISQLDHSELVIFIDSNASIANENTYVIKELFQSMHDHREKVPLLLKETEYFICPMDYYMDRLEYSESGDDFAKSSSDFTLLVTQFGNPVRDVQVTLKDSLNQFNMPLPRGIVSPTNWTKNTDEDGRVTFSYTKSQSASSSQETVQRRHLL